MATKKPDLYILVSDLEAFAPSSVAPYVDGKVVVDAIGRRWVSDADAKVILAKAEAEWQAECNRRADFDTWQKDRVARRQALLVEVGTKALAGSQFNASTQAAVGEAQRRALEKFDAAEPELDYFRWVETR
jgi:hypothetical protein